MSYAIPGAATDLETLQNAATTNANGSELEVLGHSIVVFEVSKTGSPTFTVNFEGSIDGTTYVALECQTILDGTKVTTATAVGQFRSDCSGLQSVRARTSGVSGADADNNVTVKARALPIPVGSMLADVSISAETITTNLAGDDSDLDSGAGTDNHDVVAIGVAASGGHAVITGDAANGLDVDVTR